MGVYLREKKVGNGKVSYYLDIYHNKMRWYEFLKITVGQAHPTQQDKEKKRLANKIRIKRENAVLSAIARAARGGVLIKGGRPLEDLGEITAIAFDKTGTLTEGKPKLTNVITLGGFNEETLLGILIAVESLSDHPLAKAIVAGATERIKKKLELKAENIQSILGRGIRATINGIEIIAGNLNLFDELDERKPSREIKDTVKAL